MLTQIVQDAINNQINMEFESSYNYLGMASYCELHNFPGCAAWLLLQSQEENAHAMRLRKFLLDRNCAVALHSISQAPVDFKSIPDVFAKSLAQEKAVSQSINELYELALENKAFAALVELHWFITEQVEEEKTVRDIVAKMGMVQEDPAALIDLDRELGERKPEAEDGE